MDPEMPASNPFNNSPATGPEAPSGATPSAPAQPVSPAAAPVPPTAPNPSSQDFKSAPNKGSKKKQLTLIGIVAAVIVLLLSVGAAAYYGVILPNKPENKLASAFTNLAEHKQMTLKGRMDVLLKDSSSDFKGVAIDYTTKINLEKSLLDTSGEVGVSGSKFPYDLRFIDQDMYFRVGGLSSLGPLLNTLAEPDMETYAQMLSNINDQWYVIDRSFWQEGGESVACVADLSFALNNDDVDKIEAAYKKYPLFNIKNTSSADVDDTPTTKYELDPASDEIASNFAKELESLSVVKKIKDCADETGVSENVLETESTDEAKEKMYAYVTGDNQLKKIEIDVDDKEASVKLTATFDFNNVTIEKPEGAKPIQEILGDMFGGLEPGGFDMQADLFEGAVLE